MAFHSDRLKPYVSFIQDPQAFGTWQLQLNLTNRGLTSLLKLLNAGEYQTYRPAYRRFGRPMAGIVGEPPMLLPRLFAYLRAALPKATTTGFPPLVVPPPEKRPRWRWTLADAVLYFYGSALSPRNLGASKQRALASAARIYAAEIAYGTIRPVPQDANMIDFVAQRHALYFQHWEPQPGQIRIASPREDTVLAIRDIFHKLPQIEHHSDVIRVFSPEYRLLQMYLPIMRILSLPQLLPEQAYVRLLLQALEEAEEWRFTHCVRTIGIAAEELIVEAFETILRQKAPASPLGSLLADLNNRLQAITQGTRAPVPADLKSLRRELQSLIKAESASRNPNPQLVSLAEVLKTSLIPAMQACCDVAASIARSNPTTPKTGLFPPRVQRCLEELVVLRNLVSHRAERASSLTPVSHIDAALAFRAYMAIAIWWLGERTKVDYKAAPKAIVADIISRSRGSSGT